MPRTQITLAKLLTIVLRTYELTTHDMSDHLLAVHFDLTALIQLLVGCTQAFDPAFTKDDQMPG